MGGLGGNKGFVEGTLAAEGPGLGMSVDAEDVHFPGTGMAGGYGAGGVELMAEFDDLTGDLALGFIADRPDDDAGVVAIPANPGS